MKLTNANHQPGSDRGNPSAPPARYRTRWIAKRLALSAASLILILLAAEGVTRLIGAGGVLFFRRSDTLGYGHVPGMSGYAFLGEEVHINSLGLRDREIPYEKAPGVFRVLILGDSHAWGTGVSVEQTMAKRLEGALAAKSGLTVEVINAGINGYGTFQEREFYRHEGVKYDPDAVVIAFCSNDADGVSSVEDVHAQIYALPIPFPDFFRTRSYLYGYLARSYVRLRAGQRAQRAPETAPVVPTTLDDAARKLAARPEWQNCLRLLSELASECQANGDHLAVVPIPRSGQVHGDSFTDFQKVLADYCEGEPIAFVDPLPLFREAAEPDQRNLFIPNDGHIDADGHSLMAESVVPLVRQWAASGSR